MKTFREQFDKLCKAYLNRVNPNDPCACFVGNLLNGSTMWSKARRIDKDGDNFKKLWVSKKRLYDVARSIRLNSEGTYTPDDIYKLERLFMRTWAEGYMTEESLFEAFEKTILLLKEIHESKGEIVEDYSFQKRELVL